MIKSVTIIGAGNCGCAFAADLENRGIHALLYAHPEHTTNIDAILADGGFLEATGPVVSGRFRTAVTTDMEQALRFSNLVIIAVPSYAQDDILTELERFDLSRHVLVACGGNLFTLVARRRIRARYFLETSASPYGSRMMIDSSSQSGGGSAEMQGERQQRWRGISVFGVKTGMPIAALPTDIDADLRADITTVFPGELRWCASVLEVALYNFNGVLHPVTAVMNAGRIESAAKEMGDDDNAGFYFYREGMTPAVTSVMQCIDDERRGVAGAYGASVPSCLEMMNMYYGLGHKSLEEFALGSELHSTMKLCPKSMHHRYLREDLPYVLVPWYELGRRAGRASPFMRSLILWASAINGIDYLGVGRNLRALGLADCSLGEIVDIVTATSDTIDAELLRYAETDQAITAPSLMPEPVATGVQASTGMVPMQYMADGGLGGRIERAKL